MGRIGNSDFVNDLVEATEDYAGGGKACARKGKLPVTRGEVVHQR